MAKSPKTSEVVPSPMERKPELRLSFPPKSGGLAAKLKGVQIGKSVTLEVTGKVRGINFDDYEHSLRLDVRSVDVEPTMGRQIEELRESRTGR